VIRVGALGDVHLDEALRGRLRPLLASVPEHADVLLLAGDLTRHGTRDEATVAAGEFADLGVPVIAVLGNHDYHSDQQDSVRGALEDAGLTVLEGEIAVVDIGGCRLGVAGAKGFGLGFAGRCGSEFGEPEMKAFARSGREAAEQLSAALAAVRRQAPDFTVALTHYSPVEDTLAGEPPQIWPFLGSYLLAEAIDCEGADLAIHGHAHAGVEKGLTAGGVRVRNVAQPVIRRPYAVYCLDAAALDANVRDAAARDATARDATARDATARDATARDATARDATVVA
jgi:Icc-related predicted phosphoesterase